MCSGRKVRGEVDIKEAKNRGGLTYRIFASNSNFCAKIQNSNSENRSEHFFIGFINRSTAKNFPIETFLIMTDSSIKNLGEFEYDDQNWL